MGIERAVAHGYLRARVPGHWARREHAIGHRAATRPRSQLGELQAYMASLGLASSGPSPDGPRASVA